MKHSPEERRRQREQFRHMSRKQKLEYIWLYYKVPILLSVLVLGLLCSCLHRAITKKEPTLYLASLNVSMGEDLETTLTEDYIRFRHQDPRKHQVALYRNLYLSEDPAASDHEYAYASKMKLFAAINAKQLDLVLMNREAYGLCSQSGFLMDLSGMADDQFLTAPQPDAIELTLLPTFQAANFSGKVYLGIIANTPRPEECRQYLHYILSESAQNPNMLPLCWQ